MGCIFVASCSALFLWTLFLHYLLQTFCADWSWLQQHLNDVCRWPAPLHHDSNSHGSTRVHWCGWSFLWSSTFLWTQAECRKICGGSQPCGDWCWQGPGHTCWTHFLRIPTRHAGIVRIKFSKQATYLGVIMSYNDSASLTLVTDWKQQDETFTAWNICLARTPRSTCDSSKMLFRSCRGIKSSMASYKRSLGTLGMRHPIFLKKHIVCKVSQKEVQRTFFFALGSGQPTRWYPLNHRQADWRHMVSPRVHLTTPEPRGLRPTRHTNWVQVR